MPETAEKPTTRMRPIRADLADPDYQRLRAAADRERRSIASYTRNAIVDRIQADLARIAADESK